MTNLHHLSRRIMSTSHRLYREFHHSVILFWTAILNWTAILRWATIAVAIGFVSPVDGQGVLKQRLHGVQGRVTDCDSFPYEGSVSGGFSMPSYQPRRSQSFPGHSLADPTVGMPGPGVSPGEGAPSSISPSERDSSTASDGGTTAADTADSLFAAPDTGTDGFGDLSNLTLSSLTGSTGAGIQSGSFSDAPTMTGDLFGSGLSQLSGTQTLNFQYSLEGFILNGQPSGSANAVLGFGIGGGPPSDIITTGTGMDTNSDFYINEFSIQEPIPPSNAGTSPGPGFVFDGGTAVYADTGPFFADGDNWTVAYSYSQTIGNYNEPIRLAGPDVATRRVKLAENFSPEVRDRAYMNYSYFDNVFGGLGNVNRWVLGLERVFYEDIFSIEVRLPMATTLGSRQDIDAPGDRNYELGNLTTIAKAVLFRDAETIWTSGLGVTAPLARDSRLMRGDQTLLQIQNQAVHLLPFAAMLKRLSDDHLVQLYTQLDVDVNGNNIRGDLTGGALPDLGRLRSSTLFHLDASYHCTLLRRPSGNHVREVIGNLELHYTGSLEKARTVRGNGLSVTDLATRFDIVNATFSSHWLIGENMVMTPGMSIPLTTGMNRQFNYEAMLQLNYLF